MTEPVDDIDRLFARLERAAAPANFSAQVLARTVGRPRTVLAWRWLIAGILAMALLGMAGYLAGASLASSDGLEVLEMLVGDAGLLTTAPGDVLAAIGEMMPWRVVALAGASAALLIWAAGRVISRSPGSA
ncbi:MAG TPA: hypothetical protein VFG86_18930 [Chloroflexota bacterium]|jgi:hypothetical protein|nr:hypothetical protein [Chloroflexota bacterium]